jgi:transglutaminase-like putative cysteine protease
MKYRVVHRTRYSYGQPVVLCHNEARMQPRGTERQVCRVSTVAIEPDPAQRAEREDFFGNRVLYFAVQEPHEQLTVTASSEVEVASPVPVELERSAAWDAARDGPALEDDQAGRTVRQFLLDSECAAAFADAARYAGPSFPPGRPLLAAVRDLTSRIHREFRFDPLSTTVATPVAEVLERRHGVCQDFAHLAISALRSLGFAARYVSGYVETVAPPGEPRLDGSDASHAWFAVYAPDCGWVDFDPTNDCVPDERYVTTAWGRDYADVAPLKGVIFGGGAHSLEVAVDVARCE